MATPERLAYSQPDPYMEKGLAEQERRKKALAAQEQAKRNAYANYNAAAEREDALINAASDEKNRVLAQKLAQKELDDQRQRELVEQEQARRALSIGQAKLKQAQEDPAYAAYMQKKNALQMEQEREEQNPDSLGSQPMVRRVGEAKGGFKDATQTFEAADPNQRFVWVGNTKIDRFGPDGKKNPEVASREAWDAYNKMHGLEANPESIGGKKLNPFPFGSMVTKEGETGATLPMFEVQEPKKEEPKNVKEMLKDIDDRDWWATLVSGLGNAFGRAAWLNPDTTVSDMIAKDKERKSQREAEDKAYQRELEKLGKEQEFSAKENALTRSSSLNEAYVRAGLENERQRVAAIIEAAKMNQASPEDLAYLKSKGINIKNNVQISSAPQDPTGWREEQSRARTQAAQQQGGGG